MEHEIDKLGDWVGIRTWHIFRRKGIPRMLSPDAKKR